MVLEGCYKRQITASRLLRRVENATLRNFISHAGWDCCGWLAFVPLLEASTLFERHSCDSCVMRGFVNLGIKRTELKGAVFKW
jgi:hypothetical protein